MSLSSYLLAVSVSASLVSLHCLQYIEHVLSSYAVFFRYETIQAFVFVVLLCVYVQYISTYFVPMMKGEHLAPYDMMNKNKFHPPSFIDLGFSDIKKYGDYWMYKHKNFSFCAAQGFRGYMEDRMHYMHDPNNNLSIFGIFDGHGGDFVSDYLEANYAKAIRHRLIKSRNIRRLSIDSHLSDDDPICEALVTEVHRLDDELCRLEGTHLTGSTLISAIVESNRYLSVVSVGDSRAVACDWNNRPFALSHDHKPDDKTELRRITSAGGFVEFDGDCHRVQGILAVARSFGDSVLKKEGVLTVHPDVVRIDLHEKRIKFLIVGTDGFWDVVNNKEAVDYAKAFLRRSPAWHRVARHLVNLALSRHSKDNVSVLFIKF